MLATRRHSRFGDVPFCNSLERFLDARVRTK
jgi:hypothetical protein